ncbi:hypothetical protein AAIH32_00255 [Pseudarthrobacter oxydans]|uniref:hypothetical protein n=1 Tax=Pseudarthrobacter oxydans TaxID=1671 RepID=UPI003D29A1AE
MSSIPPTAKDVRIGDTPVPAPPTKPLVTPRAVQQISLARRREHEVQRVIRDLATLATNQAPGTARA